MGDISASAEKRAEILLKNAEMDAARMQREANESVDRINEETVTLRNRWNMFRTRYKNLLETELERFDILSTELFADRDFEDLKFQKDENVEKENSLNGEKMNPMSSETIVSKPFIENRATDHKTITNFRIGDGV